MSAAPDLREAFSDEQRTELHLAAQQSREAYERERDDLLRSIDTTLRRHRQQRAGLLNETFLLSGGIGEYLGSLELCAAELRDNELMNAVRSVRRTVVVLQGLLAKRRQAIEPDERSSSTSAPAELSTHKGR